MSSVASLDTSSADSYSDDEEERRIQQEWEDSIQQLHLLVSTLILPFFGKWLGRKTAHWGEFILFTIRNTLNAFEKPMGDICSSAGHNDSSCSGDEDCQEGLRIFHQNA